MKKSKRNLSALLSFIMSVVSVGVAPVKALDNGFDDDDILNTDLGESMNGYSSLVDSGSVLAGVAVFTLAGSLIGKRLYLNSAARAKACLEGRARLMTDNEKRLVFDVVSNMPKGTYVIYGLALALNNSNDIRQLSDAQRLEMNVKTIKTAMMYKFLNKLGNVYSGDEANHLNEILFYISEAEFGKNYPNSKMTLEELEKTLNFGVKCVDKIVKGDAIPENMNDQEQKTLAKLKNVISYINKLENEDIWKICLNVRNGVIVAGDAANHDGSKTITWYEMQEDETKDASKPPRRVIDNIKIDF